MKDFYTILEVDPTASHKEIKKSYRRLALKYHPDRNLNNKDNEKLFIDINEAYHILSNEEFRKNYDVRYRKKISSYSQPITPYIFLKKFQDIRKFIYDRGINKISKNALYSGLEKLLSDENINFLLLKSDKEVRKQIIIENLKCIKFLSSLDKEKIIIKLLKLADNDHSLVALISFSTNQTENKYFFTSIFSKFTYKIKQMFVP